MATTSNPCFCAKAILARRTSRITGSAGAAVMLFVFIVLEQLFRATDHRQAEAQVCNPCPQAASDVWVRDMLEIPRDKVIHAVNGGHRNVDGIGSSPIWNKAAPNKPGRHGTDVFGDRESMGSEQQCQPCRSHLRLALLGLLDRLQRREEVKSGTASVPPKAGTRLPRCLDQAGRRPGHVVARNRRLYVRARHSCRWLMRKAEPRRSDEIRHISAAISTTAPRVSVRCHGGLKCTAIRRHT